MSQEFKNWLQDAGVEWDSLNSDKRVQYKVSFDKLIGKVFVSQLLLNLIFDVSSATSPSCSMHI